MSSESPDGLLKYCSADTGEQILASSSLRWSSPELFSDPFELSSKPDLGCDPESLLEATVKLASSMIFSSDNPKGNSNLVNAIKRWRDEERFSTPDEAYDVLKELLGKIVSYRAEQLGESMKEWYSLVKNLRICCFCEKPDNIIAWEKYANRHQGIALRFSTSGDSTFSSSQPIIYQAEPARLTTIKEQLSAILNNKKDDIAQTFKGQFLNKGLHHKLEKEWRCIKSRPTNIPPNEETPNNGFDDIPFDKQELESVYFGLTTSVEAKNRIANTIKADYKNVKLFQLIRGKSGYTLEVEKL